MTAKRPAAALPKLSQLEIDVGQMIEDHLMLLEGCPTGQLDPVRDAILHDLKPLLQAAEGMFNAMLCEGNEPEPLKYLGAKQWLRKLNK